MIKKNKKDKRGRGFIYVVLLLFLVVEILILVLHSFVFGRGLHLNWTISRYVGTDYWSAILFGLVNLCVVALMMIYFLRIKKENGLSVFWLILVAIMILAFLGVDCCPIGLFDKSWGEFGLISRFHRLFSKTLFVTMMVIVVDTLFEMRKKKNEIMMIYGIILLIFAGFCTYGYVFETPFFMQNILLFESAYILANLVFYGLIRAKNKK